MEEIRKKDQIRVLYVEDEDLAREKLGKFLKRRFEEVELCANGLDGFFKFQEFSNQNKKFDLIISDINMPKMDGLEMLEKIRAYDEKVPCVFVTARHETEPLIKAINLQTRDYILKPIDLEVITKKLDAICEDIYYKKNFENQKIEMQNYLDIINQEALVSRTDLDGNITYVNEGFCEVSGYSQDELVGSPHNIIRHPDVPKTFFGEMWKTIKQGKIWNGTHKNLAKDGTTYFVNTKIFPIFDSNRENVTEYMGIRFLVTDEELEKRKNFRRFIEQLTEYKKTIGKLKSEKENLDKRLIETQRMFSTLEEKARVSEEKRKLLLQQLEAYESNSLNHNKMEIIAKQDKSKQFDDMYKSLNALKAKNLKSENDLKTMHSMYEEKVKEINDYVDKDIQLQKRINDLKDLVSNLQKENEALKTNRKFF